MTSIIDDNLLSAEAVDDPYKYFGRIREASRAYWNPQYDSWLITRYDDVIAGFATPAFSADRLKALESRNEMHEVVEVLQRWMVFNDPPDHKRLRRAAAIAFTNDGMKAMRPRVRELVGELLDAIDPGSTIDFVECCALPLPALVIGELLGVPESDRGFFRSRSDQLISLIFGALDDGDRHVQGRTAALELRDYFASLVATYSSVGGDNLIVRLLLASPRYRLSRDEIVATCVLLLFAGHVTTASLLASSLMNLLAFPDQQHHLRKNLDAMALAVDELIRFDGPSKVSVRWIKTDILFAGTEMSAGQRVLLVQAAANRDPRQFVTPDELRLDRAEGRNVGFGYGIHYCLGAPLARLETEEMLGAVLHRFERLELAASHLHWHRNLLDRSLLSLPVRVSHTPAQISHRHKGERSE